MRAARAARGRAAVDVALGAAAGINHRSRPLVSADRRLSKPTSKRAILRRVPKGSATKRSKLAVRTRAGIHESLLRRDTASRFPMPYPGVDRGRPPRAAALSSPIAVSTAQHKKLHYAVKGSELDAAVSHDPPRRVMVGSSNVGTKTGDRLKRPRSASTALSRFVAGEPLSPAICGGRTTAYSQPSRSLSKPQEGRTDWPDAQIRGGRGRASVDKKHTRPASAPSRRRSRDKETHDLEGLSSVADGSYSSPADLRIMKWVVLRETYLNKLHGVVAASRKRAKSSPRKGKTNDDHHNRDERRGLKRLFGLLIELLMVLRRITVEIVEAVERWRGDDTERPFIWGSSNYLVKIVGDVSFLATLPGLEKYLGVSIGNNPLLCHVRLDGRPAFLASNKVDGQGNAVSPAPGKLSCTSGSLGVSPERVEAAAEVLRREVLHATGGGQRKNYVSHAGRGDHPGGPGRGSRSDAQPIWASRSGGGRRSDSPLDSTGDCPLSSYLADDGDDDVTFGGDAQVGVRSERVQVQAARTGADETPDFHHGDNGTHGQIEERPSPFMAIHEMLTGLQADLHATGLVGRIGSTAEGGAEDARRAFGTSGEDGAYSGGDSRQTLQTNGGKEGGDGDDTSRGEMPNALKLAAVQGEGGESLRQHAAYEKQIQQLPATRTTVVPRQLSPRGNNEESDMEYIERLKQKTSGEKIAENFTAWAERTKARLRYRDAKAAKHYCCRRMCKALSVWEKYRAFILGRRLATAFAGRFGIWNRACVRFAFDALRVHAKGSRIAVRNRSFVIAICERLGRVGKVRLKRAWQRWLRVTGQLYRCREYEETITRLCELHVKARVSRALTTWRGSVSGNSAQVKTEQGVVAALMRAKLAGSFVAAVSRGGKGMPQTTAPTQQEESWEQWLGDEDSVSRVSPGRATSRGAATPERCVPETLSVDIGRAAPDEDRDTSPRFELRRLGAKMKTITSFRDIRDKTQAQRQRLPSPASFSLGSSPTNLTRTIAGKLAADAPAASDSATECADAWHTQRDVGSNADQGKTLGRPMVAAGSSPQHRDAEGQTHVSAAAGRIQSAWRASHERRIAVTVTSSVSLIQCTWRLHVKRGRAAVRVVRAWRTRSRVRARTLNQALIEAAAEGDIRTVAFLLQPRVGWSVAADENATGSDGATPLHAACRREPGALMSSNADKYKTHDSSKSTVASANKGSIGVSGSNGGGGAGGRRNNGDWVGVIRALVEAGAAIEATDGHGLTPMMATAAGEGGGEEIAALAAVGAEVDVAEAGIGRRTPLGIAAQRAIASATLALLEFGARASFTVGDGLTPLHEAAGAGSIAVAEMLIRAGAKVNATDRSAGMTPLHFAVANDQHAAARLLVHSGADVSLPDARGLTPLRLSIEIANAATIQLLLAAEPPADLNVEDKDGGTVLHAACRLGLTDVAKLLLDAGANPHARDTLGRTPRLVALDLNQADCAGLFYKMAIRSSPDPSRIARDGQRAAETHQPFSATVENKPGQGDIYPRSGEERADGGGGRTSLGSQWEWKESRELGWWDPTKSEVATGVWGGQEVDHLQHGGDSTTLHGPGTNQEGHDVEGEVETRHQEEEWTSTADTRRQSLRVDFEKAVLVARRASGVILSTEQQQAVLVTAPSVSGGEEHGHAVAQYLGVVGSGQRDVERGDEGEWTWSATEGWIVAETSVEKESPSAVVQINDGQDDEDAFRQPRRSASYSKWKSSCTIGNGDADNRVDDAQQWTEGGYGTFPEDRAAKGGSDTNQTQPHHRRRLRNDDPGCTIDLRDTIPESHRTSGGGYDEQDEDGAAGPGTQTFRHDTGRADDGPHDSRAVSLDDNGSGNSYADEKDPVELPASATRGMVGGERARDMAPSTGWSRVAAVFRAKSTWVPLVDREPGRVYYLDQQSGLTQWKAPEDGDDVVPSDDLAEDDE